MAKYRKKPVVIEAVQFFKEMEETCALPDGVDIQYFTEPPIDGETGEYGSIPGFYPVIKTLEGPHIVRDGDWIITGVKGERYARKPDIFELTYEAA